MKKKLIAMMLTVVLIGGIGTVLIKNGDGGKNPEGISNSLEQSIDKETKLEKENIVAENEIDKDNKVENNEYVTRSENDDAETNKDDNSSGNNINSNSGNDDIIIDSNTNYSGQAIKESEQQVVSDIQEWQYFDNARPNESTPIENIGTGLQNELFMAEVERLIYEKVNEQRIAAGCSAVSYNNVMEKYARIKSQDMGDNNYFSHNDLNGNLITAKMQADGITYNAWGENIAYISGITDANALAEQFMTNWMNSQGHRENILSTNFTSLGVGVYKIGDKVYATQEFCR